MKENNNNINKTELRLRIYYSVKLILITIILAFFVKFFLFSIIKISGQQMEPTILNGDRLLIFKRYSIQLFSFLFKPAYNKIVLFNYDRSKKPFLLRVAAKSNDVIRIDSGVVYVNNSNSQKINLFKPESNELIPSEYSPRDFFEPYKVPAKGELITLSKTSLRDLFFALEIIKQENPNKKIEIKTQIFIGDSIKKDYKIEKFYLYEGSLDSVPDSLNNWFFWTKLKEFLDYTKEKDRVLLYFSISIDSIVIDEYQVKNNYLFLLADNRKEGLDSRFIGPISISNCIGTPVMVLFSIGKDLNKKTKIRFKRIGRLII